MQTLVTKENCRFYRCIKTHIHRKCTVVMVTFVKVQALHSHQSIPADLAQLVRKPEHFPLKFTCRVRIPRGGVSGKRLGGCEFESPAE